MPGRDGTGPMGKGSMTGRGAGFCTGVNETGYGIGRGMGYGAGRGRGLGRGLGRGFGRGLGRGFAVNQTSKKQLLQEQKTMLQEQLEVIDKELERL